MNHKPIILTKEGYDNLKQELDTLTQEKLAAAIKRVAKAREFGDLSENSEYHAAREDHAWIQGRIEELEEILSHAQISPAKNGSGEVSVGSSVTLEINGTQHQFSIVGEWEADPTEKKISHESPLGQALVGKKAGDQVEVEAPAGKVIYTIKQVA
jgi:transcription elongation factor GreA